MRNLGLKLSFAAAQIAALAFPALALAQAAPAPAEPPPAEPAPAPEAPAAPEPAPPAAAPPPAAAAPEAPPANPEPAPPPPAAAAAPALAPAAEAEEKPPPAPGINGFVEGAYHRNLTDPHNLRAPAGHVYDTNNSFLLHAAHLAISHSLTDAVNAVFEFDVGWDAQFGNGNVGINPNNPPNLLDLQEAYVVYKASFGELSFLNVTGGKFVTYQGIEVIEGPLNPTITRGYLFGFAEPFGHVGVKVHYEHEGVVNVGVGLVNGWDVLRDNNDGKTVIFRIGTTPVDEFFAGFSGTYGPEQAGNEDNRRLSLDFTGGVVPVEEITINFQANYGMEENAVVTDPVSGATSDGSWWGLGLQPVLKIDSFSLGLRGEYFKDNDGARMLSDDTSWINATITPGYTIDNLTFRAEYRFDTASEAVFANGSHDAVTGLPNTDEQQHTVAASMHYVF